MKYQSIDTLQKTLSETVFHYAKDRKKAAGRSLGTLVEIVTFYTLRSWNLLGHIVIERKIPEFANPNITHNVEFSLHPIKSTQIVEIEDYKLPISATKLKPKLSFLKKEKLKSSQVLSRNGIKRNATVLFESRDGPVVANLNSMNEKTCNILVNQLLSHPFAIFECKRVGVEEGLKKGPQTIEKAKQGAYVARTVSSLQKVRLRNGEFNGVIEQRNGEFYSGPYVDILKKVIKSPLYSEYEGFILTIGIVSNHGNWFTSNHHTKELTILAQSYDWLLFLTDSGLSKFIDNLLLNPTNELIPARKAFLSSYNADVKINRFTKVRIDIEADQALQNYFDNHKTEICDWFNVIAPNKGTLDELRSILGILGEKEISYDCR